MSRVICQRCQKPQVSCICQLFVAVDNDIDVIVLQHPSEVKQNKGSVTLLKESLSHCTVIQGEVFSDNAMYQALVTDLSAETALLYPSDKAVLANELTMISAQEATTKVQIKRLILLDGTWKKAYRMYMSNPALHDLNHLTLPDDIECMYEARSTKKKGALSTLEAACHALSQLEYNAIKYQPLLHSFKRFNQQLLANRPPLS
ncbi:tRNA-uridine aminocarboxypropyltransferase [Thalassotalea sediminis]|uniref:tRNA-uridine aminocarboxypropyltransferase n=1 Tax=Thalassotalea sediminis TaxID=1759089 RepID=UPI0025743C18|nr:tRNA-uridine aminocarboxypropyltransferase [Thalassotalea sediminis]